MTDLERPKEMAEKLLKEIKAIKEELAKITEVVESYQLIGTVQECREAMYMKKKVEQMAKSFHNMGSLAFDRPESATDAAIQSMARMQAQKYNHDRDERIAYLEKRLADKEAEIRALKGE